MKCGQHQWVPSLFSISLRPRWEKTLPENYFPYLKTFFLKKIVLQFCFSYIACYLILSPYTLLIGLLLKYMSLFHSRQLVKHFRNIANWCRVTISNDKSWLLSLFCCCFSSIFVKVIVTCELCVIFVGEGTHSGFAFTVGCPWYKKGMWKLTLFEKGWLM